MKSLPSVTNNPVILAFALTMILAGTGGSIAHAEVRIECVVPLNVECTVSDPQGIQSITVQLQTGFGPVNVVEESYSCVSSAVVAWDPIVPGGDIMVTTCGSGMPSKAGRGYAQEATNYDLHNGVIYRKDLGTTSALQRAGIDYVLRAPLRIVRAVGSRVVMQMEPLLSAYSIVSTGPALMSTTMCCDEGTMNNCFSVNLLAQCGEGLDFVSCYEDEAAGQSVCESHSN